MLPPALFYGLGSVLLFFGVLRLTYLGVFADKKKPAKRTEDPESVDQGDVDIEGETREERYRRPPRMGFGLINMMGLGRMSPAKRHTVMGALWILLGLYMAWTGFSLSRKQNSAVTDTTLPPRTIRATFLNPATPVVH